MALKIKKFIGSTLGAMGGASIGGAIAGPLGSIAGAIGGSSLGNIVSPNMPKPSDPRMEMGIKLKEQLLNAQIPDVEKQRLISKFLPEGVGSQSLIDLSKLDEVTAELSKLTGISDIATQRAQDMTTVLTRQPGKQQTLLTGSRR